MIDRCEKHGWGLPCNICLIQQKKADGTYEAWKKEQDLRADEEFRQILDDEYRQMIEEGPRI